MSVITIPRKIAENDDLVVIPRKEYEALIELKKIREFVPTQAQKSDLHAGRKEYARGKTLSYHEVSRQLGFAN